MQWEGEMVKLFLSWKPAFPLRGPRRFSGIHAGWNESSYACEDSSARSISDMMAALIGLGSIGQAATNSSKPKLPCGQLSALWLAAEPGEI